MSGYLQRLASSAMHPAQAIHPVLGSVFSHRYGADEPAFQPEEEGVTSGAPAAPSLVPTPESGSEIQESRAVHIESSTTAAPGRLRATVPEISKAEPSATAIDEEARIFRPLLSPKEKAPPTQAERSPRNEPSNAGPEHEPAFQRAYTPLLTPEFHSPARTTSVSSGSSPYIRAGAKPDMPNRANRPTATEPEEIQIHIGRIEVTAVPQTQTRPTVKAARKGMSLDEYLKGRNRRA